MIHQWAPKTRETPVVCVVAPRHSQESILVGAHDQWTCPGYEKYRLIAVIATNPEIKCMYRMTAIAKSAAIYVLHALFCISSLQFLFRAAITAITSILYCCFNCPVSLDTTLIPYWFPQGKHTASSLQLPLAGYTAYRCVPCPPTDTKTTFD